MPMSRLVGFLWVAALAVGCAPRSEEPVSLNTEREALLQTDREFSEHSRQLGAAAAFEHFLVENALGLPAGAGPTFHRDSLVTNLAGDFTLTWEPQYAEVAASGDLGWTWGRYELHATGPDGTEEASYGKYLNVWRKQPDGNWRVVADIGNANPKPEP